MNSNILEVKEFTNKNKFKYLEFLTDYSAQSRLAGSCLIRHQ